MEAGGGASTGMGIVTNSSTLRILKIVPAGQGLKRGGRRKREFASIRGHRNFQGRRGRRADTLGKANDFYRTGGGL
jgi:hypothetical protein